jgi:F0F1-type ATP synthase membrane subunit c/vacuolar-type H+-ATPase subunit K
MDRLAPGDKLVAAAARIRNSISEGAKEGFAQNRKDYEAHLKELADTSDAVFLAIEKKFKAKEDAKVAAAEAATEKLKAFLRTLFKGTTETSDFNKRITEWVTAAKEISILVADAFVSGLDNLSGALTDLIFKGKADFQALAQSMFEEVTRIMIRAALAAAIGDIFSGGGQGMVVASMNQATAAQNTISSTLNQTAAVTNTTAAAQMLVAANINLAASASSGIAGVGHAGGMVGSLSRSRTVPTSTFSGAPRFHNGLASNEFASILERGEVVLNKANVAEMKQQDSAGASGGGSNVTQVFNVSAIDAKGVAQFFKTNRKQIGNAMNTNSQQNNAVRRSRR